MAADNTTVEEKRRRRRKSRAEESTETEAVAIVGKGQATPGRRQREEEEDAPVSLPRRIINYFQDVRSELTKVVWPTREEVARLMRIVIATTVAMAAFLGIISLLFNFFVQLGLDNPILFIVAFALITAGAIFYIRRGDMPKRSY